MPSAGRSTRRGTAAPGGGGRRVEGGAASHLSNGAGLGRGVAQRCEGALCKAPKLLYADFHRGVIPAAVWLRVRDIVGLNRGSAGCAGRGSHDSLGAAGGGR